jgi:flavin reductase (DIM6/NTAB) family NADH-FMN oxidoreductase RutF
MTVDPAGLRHALSHFTTGVTIVTTLCPRGTRQGITANSFNSVSLDPPLVLVSLARSLACYEHFRVCDAFAVNVLRADQQALSARFSSRGADKWRDVDYDLGELGVPVLRDRLAVFECRPYAQYDGGDHEILVGRVERFDLTAGGPPLVYYQGGYREIAR